MGLCKCPKRKVTNQFCYEHRVNVCENCMVTTHPKCIVLSYLQWLQDSDYNPICELCSSGLTNGECIRLICYHVYHWTCFDLHCRRLSPVYDDTRVHKCPSCKSPIYPPSNLVSPVADVLREKLSGVNWARPFFGLPPLPEEEYNSPSISEQREKDQVRITSICDQNERSVTSLKDREIAIHPEEPTVVYNRVDNYSQVPRRLVHTVEDKVPLINSCDHDENKYKRRVTTSDKFINIGLCNSVRRNVRPGRFRFIIIGLIGLIGFMSVILILSKLGHWATDDDPSFDPLNNPNIRISE